MIFLLNSMCTECKHDRKTCSLWCKITPQEFFKKSVYDTTIGAYPKSDPVLCSY